MRRLLSTALCIFSAASLGLTSPAIAQPASQQLEKSQKELLATLGQQTQGKNLRFYDASGNLIAPEKLATQPEAFREGITIETGEHRIQVKAELLNEGKDGAKLFFSHLLNNQIVNGQVVTLSPGTSKLEFEQRLNDVTESLFLNTLEAKHKAAGADQRKLASSHAGPDCSTKHILIGITTVIFFVSLLSFLIKGATRAKGAALFSTMAALGMAWLTSPGSGDCR